MNDVVSKVMGRYIPEASAPTAIAERGIWEWLRDSPVFARACTDQPEVLDPKNLTLVESSQSRATVSVPTMLSDHESRTAMLYEVEFVVTLADGQPRVTRKAGV